MVDLGSPVAGCGHVRIQPGVLAVKPGFCSGRSASSGLPVIAALSAALLA
jgi:hypothetical protein